MTLIERLRNWLTAPEPQRPGFTEDDAIRIMREVGNHALADEMQRGMDRRNEPPRLRNYQPLHAHELTAEDAAAIRMFATCTFSDEASVTLPSGRLISGKEMQQWCSAREADG